MTRKTIVIAVREFKAAIRTRTFFVSLIMMPIFMFGSIAVQMLLRDKVDVKDKHVAIVDCTGKLAESLLAEAQRRNTSDIFQGEGESRKQVRPRFVVTVEPPPAEATPEALRAQTLELSDRVRAGKLFAFFIVPPEVLDPAPKDAPSKAAVAYHSNNPTYDDVHNWLRGSISKMAHEQRLKSLNLDTGMVMKALTPVWVENLGLVTRDAAGNFQAAEKTNELASFFLPFGMLILMFMVVMITAQPLLQSVLEEKMQRIAEVLVACASPFEIMMGKLLGTVGVSLVIVTFYFAGALYALKYTGFGGLFPSHLIVWFIVFQCLAVLMYGSLFISVGAAVNDLKEAQNLITPMMLVIMIPFFLWVNVVKEPAASFSVIASLFPPATPMLMLVRMAVPPGIPLWQPILGMVLVLASTTACVFAAGRVFRIGLLSQGKAPKFSELIGWVIRG
ncbi:MAG: ABC transporter permease [Phycisphaerales bacterium]|nr:ABC transporter permease [Phycisphaerales bacterium]